jgi:hypothetical protein
MVEQSKVLLIIEDIFKNLSPGEPPFDSQQVWIDRLSGGLLSQYLRKASQKSESQNIPPFVWLKGTTIDYSDIFIIGESTEIPFSQIAKIVSQAKDKKCEYIGQLDQEVQKKGKRYFSELVSISSPLAWAEDLK